MKLRALLLGFGVLLLAGGALALSVGVPQGLPALILGALLAVGTAFERWRYKPAQNAARGKPTGERFVDPVSGELFEVYYDAATGTRSYVKAEDKIKG
ncbi:MAG: hypothetical protein ACM3ZT_06990 [Bacillota bacterium]